MERTLSIIKPDGVEKNVIGEIYKRFEDSGLTIIEAKMLHLTKMHAEVFYAEHQGKPFFNKLVNFMISGPSVVSVLESKNAIKRYRDLIGVTNPADALAGTLRADYADSITENIAHGSEFRESAAREITFFFGEGEIFPRAR